jgi:tetratricopeptide (TPR) repeat protein
VAYEAARFVATLTFDFAAAQRIARVLAAPERPAELHGIAGVLSAYLHLAAGRRAAARRELAAAAPLLPSQALKHRGYIAALPFLPADADELRSLREELLAWNPATTPPIGLPNLTYDVHHESYPAIRLYLLGALAAREGDEAALDWAAELDAIGGALHVQALARDLALGVRARLAATRGDVEGALGLLERARMESPCMYVVRQSPFYTFVTQRWLRAAMLQRLERWEEALRWYESLVQSSLYDLVYLAPSHLERARIYDRLGNRLRAASHYRRVVALWKECDPELRAAVEEAATRLQRMGSGGRTVEV